MRNDKNHSAAFGKSPVEMFGAFKREAFFGLFKQLRRAEKLQCSAPGKLLAAQRAAGVRFGSRQDGLTEQKR